MSQRRGSRTTSIAEKEGLLDSVLPSPPHPHAARRAASFGVVSIFFLLVLWLAATSGHSKGGAGSEAEMQSTVNKLQSWVYGGSDAGRWSGDESSSTSQQVLGQDGQAEDLATTKDGASSEEEDDEDITEEDDDEDNEEELDSESYLEYARNDLSRYTWHEDLPWDVEGDGRLIVIGDVHGMVDSVKEMLALLSFDNDAIGSGKDTLVFAGDLVAKHPNISKSLETIDYIRSLKAWAVRGNHDQDVINWLSFFTSWPTFQSLSDPDAKMTEAPEDTPHALKGKWRNEHYRIARLLSPEAANWLINRSMTLHIRSLHTYVVHAGLLPWTIPKRLGKKKGHKAAEADLQEAVDSIDLTNEFGIIPGVTDLTQSAQKESFVPVVGDGASTASATAPTSLDPEIALLMVKVNRDPFTLLEMRSVKKNGKVTKNSKKGRPWADFWNAVMGRCQETYLDQAMADLSIEKEGKKKKKKLARKAEKKRQTLSDSSDEEGVSASRKKKKPGQCRPLSVIYGHAAGRGLDLQPFSFGLDSGCVYGRSLSALVIEGKQYTSKLSPADDPLEVERKKKKKKSRVEETPITLTGHPARVLSLKCDKPHA